MSNIIECRSVSFSYNEGNNKTEVLKNLNFEIKSGETTHLLNDFPALYNVALPLLIMGSDKNSNYCSCLSSKTCWKS